jgi:hypothetical protein
MRLAEKLDWKGLKQRASSMGFMGFHKHISRIVGLNVPYRNEQKAISSFCYIPDGERIVDVVPGGRSSNFRLRRGVWHAAYTRNNPHLKCTMSFTSTGNEVKHIFKYTQHKVPNIRIKDEIKYLYIKKRTLKPTNIPSAPNLS